MSEQRRKRRLDHSAPTINLKVKGQDGVDVFFRVKRSTMLQKVLTAYCQKRNLEYMYIHFLYNGERFLSKRSPDDLNMQDDDEIDALMPVDGGGRAAQMKE